MSPRRRSTAIAVALAGLLGLGATGAQAATRTASLGDVAATLSWRSTAEAPFARDVSFTIAVAGVPTTPALACEDCLFPGTGALQVVDLDGGPQPEVVVTRSSGGAHCCIDAVVLRFDGAAWSPLTVETGNQGFSIGDFDDDGAVELRIRDDRFTEAFTSYAASASPIMFLRYAGGAVTDVTRELRGPVRVDAGQLRKDLRKLRPAQDHRGLLAAYVAAEDVAGRPARGRRELARQVRLGHVTPGYRRALLRRLQAWGYRAG